MNPLAWVDQNPEGHSRADAPKLLRHLCTSYHVQTSNRRVSCNDIRVMTRHWQRVLSKAPLLSASRRSALRQCIRLCDSRAVSPVAWPGRALSGSGAICWARGKTGRTDCVLFMARELGWTGSGYKINHDCYSWVKVLTLLWTQTKILSDMAINW